MLQRTRERAKLRNAVSGFTLVAAVLLLAALPLILCFSGGDVEPEPPAPPATPAYVADIEQRLDVIEAKLDGVMFRLEQVESISGETYDMLDDLLSEL